ncbi:MAG TPA: autotransporter-associated beta strand repeat-containing protein [Verrucomicrobiae bacterium]|jgi:autotransporter-associated beta strand protein|nr:autotransporter-associated beta strand repeat-containing protein [Verrucomicrobiae bacterium]
MKAQCKFTSPNPESRHLNSREATAVLRDSTRRIVFSLALLLSLAAAAGAQTIAYFADPVATSFGGASGNPPALNIGNTFHVTGAGITVFQLGAFDWQGDGLATAHTVTLFSNQVAIASVTVPAGTAAPLVNGFRLAPLPSPITLLAGDYAVVSYQMNANDPYGDYNGDNPPGFNTGASLTRGDGIYEFTLSTTSYPPTVDTGYNFVSATFTYIDSTGVWNGAGADNNWSTSANWSNGLPAFPAVVNFAGNTRPANNNDLSGITLNGIIYDPAAGAFTLNGNDITLNGNISFGANPSTLVTQKINLNMAWNSYVNIETPANGNLMLAGNITSANGLTKIDNGTLTLSGTNTIAGAIFNGGTNIITGSTTINGTGGVFYVGSRNAAYKGTLVLQPNSSLTVIGNFGDAAVIGRDGGSGTVIQNGGTLTFTPNNNQSVFVAATGSSATRAEYHMNGGLLDMGNNRLGIGFGATLSTGMVAQVSGVITNVGHLLIPFVSGGGNGIGIYTLSGGSIYIGSGGITSDGNRHEIDLGGGTVGAYSSWTSPLSMNLTNLNGSVTFNPGGNTILLSGVLSGNGGLTVAGGGVLELSGANTYTGDTSVTSGSILQLDATGSIIGAVRLANGAQLNLNFGGTYAVGGLYTNGVALPVGTYNAGNLSGFLIGSGDLQVANNISTGLWDGGGANNNWSTGANWDQNAAPIFPLSLTFAGSTRLTNNNDLSSISVSGITFDSAAGPFELDGNDITLTGPIGFSANPPAPVTQTINFNLNWTTDETIDTPTNGNLTLGGSISSANNLTKIDAATLTLGGIDSFSGYSLNGGTNIITGQVTINGSSGHRVYLGDGQSIPNASGTLVLQNGSAFTVVGSFDDALVLGRDGGSGRVIQNGGTFTYSPANQTFLFVGATSQVGTKSEYDMNGGVFDLQGNSLGVALADGGVSSTDTVNQVGGVIDNVGTLQLGSIRATGLGIYNLVGGRINIGFGGITTSSGLYALNLGGGTVGASTSWTSPLNINLTGVNGPVTFDTAGNTVILSGILSGNGGFTVTGSGGTLELTATNTYSGNTTVNAGILQLDAAGTSPGTINLANGAFLNLNFSGNYTVAHCFTNGVALPNGTYNSGNLPGFIIGSGNLQVASVVFSGQPQNQLVYLNGNFHQSVTLMTMTIGGAATYQWYLNGNPVPGATGTNLTLSGLQITNGGNYYVVATGGSGSITSSVASVTIYAVNNNVFAYDGFAYPDSVVVDGSSQNGGFGWNGPWQHTDGNGVQITLGNLIGGANVPAGYDSRSISNCIEVPSNAQTRSGRFFDCTAGSELAKQGFIDANGNIGANGKTVYLSFLQQADRTSGFYELEFHRGNLSDPGRMGGIGNDTGTGNVNLRAPNGVNNRSLGAGTTGVNFYVVRIDYKAGNDDVFVYRNPTSLTEPALPTLTVSNVADMSLSGVSVAAYNGPDLKTDEIRLGATWADAIGLAVSNLLPPTKVANGWKVSFAATPGYSYRIQRATSLTGPWMDIDTVTGPENGYVEFVDTTVPVGQSFYRTVTP